MKPLVEFKNLKKYYYMGDTVVKALDDVSFKIYEGEFVAIVGTSGSGKSTAMNIIGCLDIQTEGGYFLNDRDVSSMNNDELAEFRNQSLGFIFQQYNLLPKLTVLDNVCVPLMYGSMPKSQRHEIAKEKLDSVGLGSKMHNKPKQLSGGQQQRVSIARALAMSPSVLLADEPTGALDSKTSAEVLELLKEIHHKGNTVVLITHDNEIAYQAKRVIRLEDGNIAFDGKAEDYRELRRAMKS